MNRGAKIVIVAVVALFALTGIYYAFSSPKPRTVTSRGGDAPAAEPSAGRISDPIAPGASVPQTLTMGPASSAQGAQGGMAPTPPDAAFARTGAGSSPGAGSPSSLAPVIAPPTAPGTAPSTAPGTAPSGNDMPRILPPERTAAAPASGPAPSTSPVAINPPAAPRTSPAPSSPAVVPASTPGSVTYTVRSGDTLSTIAGDFYRDTRKWTVIASANPGLDPSKLKVGQVIKIPTEGAIARQATTVPERASAAAKPGDKFHTVSKGETLAAIAERYLGNKSAWKRLYEANRDSIGSDPAKLKVGTRLVIPTA
jgi:nucleoid-associated protein YgaU